MSKKYPDFPDRKIPDKIDQLNRIAREWMDATEDRDLTAQALALVLLGAHDGETLKEDLILAFVNTFLADVQVAFSLLELLQRGQARVYLKRGKLAWRA